MSIRVLAATLASSVHGDIAVSRARFTQDQGETPNVGRYIPGSVDTVVSLGATVTDYGPWFAQGPPRPHRSAVGRVSVLASREWLPAK